MEVQGWVGLEQSNYCFNRESWGRQTDRWEDRRAGRGGGGRDRQTDRQTDKRCCFIMERGEVMEREREGVGREGRRERKRCRCHMYVPKSGD